ncbi:MAG: DUF748 domain-containing protein [Deltaproteobacteria bacterium]|nr:DUF748 domain-containing protein [Deltaproteobacteria bacterium]
MRKLKWVIIGLAGFLILTVALAFFSRPFLTRFALKKAGEAVGAPVTLSRAELNLLAGGLVIHDLKVGDFLTVKKITVWVPPLPLLKGEKSTLTLTLKKPVLNFRRKDLDLLKPGEGESPVVIQKIAIENGSLIYNDRSAGKTTTLTKIDMEITPSGFALTARIDGEAPFRIEGKGNLFDKKTSFEAEVSLKNLPLPPFEPYYDDADNKFKITRGAASLTTQAQCKQNRLSAPVHAVIQNLELQPKRPMLFGAAAERVVEKLKDKEGNLELDFLISGDIKNPQFNLLTDLHRAIAKATASILAEEIPKAVEALPQEIKQGMEEGIEKLKGIFGQ